MSKSTNLNSLEWSPPLDLEWLGGLSFRWHSVTYLPTGRTIARTCFSGKASGLTAAICWSHNHCKWFWCPETSGSLTDPKSNWHKETKECHGLCQCKIPSGCWHWSLREPDDSVSALLNFLYLLAMFLSSHWPHSQFLLVYLSSYGMVGYWCHDDDWLMHDSLPVRGLQRNKFF